MLDCLSTSLRQEVADAAVLLSIHVEFPADPEDHEISFNFQATELRLAKKVKEESTKDSENIHPINFLDIKQEIEDETYENIYSDFFKDDKVKIVLERSSPLLDQNDNHTGKKKVSRVKKEIPNEPTDKVNVKPKKHNKVQDLPKGWTRTKESRPSGRVVCRVVTKGNLVFKSQRKLDLYLETSGLPYVSLRGENTEDAQPVEECIQKQKPGGKSEKGGVIVRKKETNIVGPKLKAGSWCHGNLPPGWTRRIVNRGNGRREFTIRTNEGVLLRSQRQLNQYARRHGFHNLKLKI